MSLFDRFRRKPNPQSPPPRVRFNFDSHPDSRKGNQEMSEEDIEALLASLEAPREQDRPQVYYFEHKALPEAAFSNHPQLMQELNGEPVTPMPLLPFWLKSEIICTHSGLIEEPDFDSDEWYENVGLLLKEITLHTTKRNGYTVHVYTMPQPVNPTEAHLIAIVHKDSEPHNHGQPSPSTRYYTLEKTIGDVPPVMCSWDAEGAHANYGSGPEPTVEAFTEAVFAHLR